MVQKQQNLIKLASPDIQEEDINRAVKVIRSGNLVEGTSTADFEVKLANFTNIQNVTVVSSATAGLHLAIKALGIGVDDYIIVPTFTFPATANIVENIGANIIFCDVEKDSYIVSPEDIEKTIINNNDKTIKAIIVVHEFGYPAQIKKISNLAKKYNLKLIEDAACALGTIADEYHIGYYSDIAVFSFHPRKAITSGEGGAVVSNNKEIIDKIKIFKNHGIQRGEDGLDFVEAGLNYRMTDFQAALMIGQIERFGIELDKRKELVKVYFEELKEVRDITLPKDYVGHSWQSFMIVLNNTTERKNLITKLLEKGIQSNLGAQSLPMLSYYKNKYKVQKDLYLSSKVLYENGLVLPLYGKLNINDIKKICKCIKEIL